MLTQLLGCAPEPSAPTLTGIEPSWGYRGEDTRVVIEGEGLLPAVIVDPHDEEPRFDAQYTAWLTSGVGEFALDAVQLEAYGRLEASVPVGLTPGRYGLRVRAPWGAVSDLQNAFTVTSTRADHLEIVLERRLADAGDPVLVGLRVEDPDGQLVDVDLPVLFTVNEGSAVEGVSLSADPGLVDPQPLPRGVGLRGLIKGGEGSVELVSAEPQELMVQVSVDDPDSSVADDIDFISVVPGSLDRLQIDLPERDFSATAGEPFEVELSLRDSLGNVLTDRSAVVYLREVCGGLVTEDDSVTLREGRAVVEVTTHVASGPGTGCEESGLEAYGEASGRSLPFAVAPGRLRELSVEVAGGEGATVTAGVPELVVLVRAEDAFGNLHRDYDAPIVFRDDVGGLDTGQGERRGSAECFAWVGGQLPCTLSLERAADVVRVTAEAPDGLSGRSPAIKVVAGAPVTLTAAARQTRVRAGESLTLAALLLDEWGNITAGSAGSFSARQGAVAVACGPATQEASGAYVLDCTPTRADAAARFEVSLASALLSGQTGLVEVANGDLAEVVLTGPASAEAGAAFALAATGHDAWGNPCTSGDLAVDLRDDSGTIDLSGFSLDSSGAWSGSVSITEASDSARVVASQGGVDLGELVLAVEPGELHHYAIELDRSLAWVGESTALRVRAEDAWGNLVTDHAEPVTLSSHAGLLLSEAVDGFSGGVADHEVVFDAAGLDDNLRVEDADGVSGSSVALDVLDGDCAQPPVATLTLDGLDETTACLSQGLATVSADASASVAGGAPLLRYHLDDGAGAAVRTTAARNTLSYEAAGLYVPELVVVDTAACGATAQAAAWVNLKGSPAGRVGVAAADTRRTAGGSAGDADTSVTVEVLDCAGDPAGGATVLARTDLGALGAGVSATTSGWSLTLDAQGTGSFTWSGQALEHDGEARVIVGTQDGAAYGEATLTVEGDSRRPEVARVDPSGATEELLDQVVIDFTEPLAVGSYSRKVSLVGPSGEESTTVTLSGDGLRLTVALADTLDTALGAWTLTLSSDIRDDSGNRLSGDWSGSTAAFSGVFGQVTDDGITVTSCAASAARLHPDGVDGAGEEADDVDISVSASATPARWLVEVLDDSGARVRSQRHASAPFTWDARADDGRVVDAGTYSVLVSSVDGQDNLSAPCALEVEVLERYVAPW